jgi:hypothetical protein
MAYVCSNKGTLTMHRIDRAASERRARRIERAAHAVILATWRNLDAKPWPQKYAAPYGALVELQKALES